MTALQQVNIRRLILSLQAGVSAVHWSIMEAEHASPEQARQEFLHSIQTRYLPQVQESLKDMRVLFSFFSRVPNDYRITGGRYPKIILFGPSDSVVDYASPHQRFRSRREARLFAKRALRHCAMVTLRVSPVGELPETRLDFFANF